MRMSFTYWSLLLWKHSRCSLKPAFFALLVALFLRLLKSLILVFLQVWQKDFSDRKSVQFTFFHKYCFFAWFWYLVSIIDPMLRKVSWSLIWGIPMYSLTKVGRFEEKTSNIDSCLVGKSTIRWNPYSFFISMNLLVIPSVYVLP